MSIKSLGAASLGLLKRGLKKTMHIASIGLLRKKEGPIEEIFVQPGGMGLGNRPVRMPDPQENNNLVVLLTTHGLL